MSHMQALLKMQIEDVYRTEDALVYRAGLGVFYVNGVRVTGGRASFGFAVGKVAQLLGDEEAVLLCACGCGKPREYLSYARTCYRRLSMTQRRLKREAG